MNTAIPKTTHQVTHQLKTTPEIRYLENQYQTLTEFAKYFGWTFQIYREYQRIKTELRDRCKEAYNKNWEDKINDISENRKNSKQIWSKMKILKGKATSHTNYMKHNEGNKYFTDKEKCDLMEQTWKDVFKITEEDNDFDKQHSDHINRYITVNHSKQSRTKILSHSLYRKTRQWKFLH